MRMYFTELDIGGLTFISNQEVTPQLVGEFLSSNKPSHVYTNIKVEGYKVTCNIMGEEYCTEVIWRTRTSKLFVGKDIK